MNARRTYLPAVMFTAMIVYAPNVLAQEGNFLKVYYTNDPRVAERIPPGAGDRQWQTTDDHGDVPVFLAGGQRMWVACRNDERGDKIKSFSMRISRVLEADDLTSFKVDAPRGYKHSSHRNGFKPTRMDGSQHEPDQIVLNYKFNPQPRWERIRITADQGDVLMRVNIRTWSLCWKVYRLPSDLFMESAGFGAEGAMDGDPRVTEIWVFPENVPIDTNLPPLMEAPPETGSWAWEFRLEDPMHEARPLGGVRLFTDGPGLRTGDEYDLRFSMMGAAAFEHDLFGFEAEAGEYFDLRLDLRRRELAECFDLHPPGELCGHGGWEEWEGSTDVCGTVTDEQAFEGTQSLRLDGITGPAGDDVVQRFDIESGRWSVRTQVFVPEDATGRGHIILLNRYPPQEDHDWSLQVQFDADTDEVSNRNAPEETAPMRKGEWVEFSAEIDLERDLVQAYYGGQHFVVDRSWVDGVAPGGQPWIQALDLYADEPDRQGIVAIYFDDVFVEAILGCLRDPEWLCDGDVDGDGQVNPVDAGLVQAAFDSIDGQDLCNYDLDCDGQINPVDSGIVQSLFGTCEAPREACP